MSLLIGFLTFLLVVNCLLLILLVLIQLPKKEAGAGVAFGGAATDALFGAGSGNALTKMTKYSATFFVGMALVLSLLNSSRARESNRRLEDELLKKANASAALLPAPAATAPAVTPTAQTAPALQATNALQSAVVTQTTARILEAPPASAPATPNVTPAPAALKQAPAAPAPVQAPTSPPVTAPATSPAPK